MEKSLLGKLLSFLTLLLCLLDHTSGVPLSLKSLSKYERSAIKKLRLLTKDTVTHEYMKDDLYLVRWLTMKSFNVDQTVPFLKQHIKWREEQKMDQVLKEDWSDFQKDYPYSLNTKDKDGRPVLYFRYGAWDISKLANSGKLKVMSRYFAKLLEEADTKVRTVRAGGQNITQFDIIINLDGYSLAKHGCYQCLSFYTEVGNTLQNHYPGTANKIVFINSPTVFATTFRLLETVLDDKIKDSIKLIGEDRHSWEPVLLEFIDRGQFPAELY